jgi:putative FmdB family regulatory protein
MPTYTYRCEKCEKIHDVIQSIRTYSEEPYVPECCGHPTTRFIEVSPATALNNATFGDRHYDGLRAPDGTDISSRTKHREYMKRHGLTTMDDFKGPWKDALKDRENFRTGKKRDKELRETIARELHRRT